MSDLLRVVCLSEGIPSDTPPGQAIDAIMLKRERSRQEMIALSLSICAGIGINLNGGDTNRILRPFYTSSEWADIEHQQEEARQEMAERQQLAKLMRMARR